MQSLARTAIAAFALACIAGPAGAGPDQGASVPFFLAPLFQPFQPMRVASAPAMPEAQDVEYNAPRRTAAAPEKDAPHPTREMIAYSGAQAPGTIVVNTSERRLYLVLGGGKAVRYAVGVGREGFQWAGTQRITSKQEWPDWRPPEDMLRRRPDLPRYMAGGPQNPLGARALYLGASVYRIHGSNEPDTIGQAVSSGCIRMLNEDVIDLYSRVKVGTQVVVLR